MFALLSLAGEPSGRPLVKTRDHKPSLSPIFLYFYGMKICRIAAQLLIPLLFLFSLISCEDENLERKTGSFKDARDGQIYKWVKIGNQTWMAENLNIG